MLIVTEPTSHAHFSSPILYKTATILLNISASSAFIERFFSICGVLCDSRRESQSDETNIKKNTHFIFLILFEFFVYNTFWKSNTYDAINARLWKVIYYVKLNDHIFALIE